MSEITEEEFWKILYDVPESKPIFYRLYHNDDGTPVCYSMEEKPGNYIDVDPSTYALSSHNVRVIKGKLIHIKPVVTVKKLQPGDSGIPCSPDDVCVVVNDTQKHIKWKIVNNELD